MAKKDQVNTYFNLPEFRDLRDFVLIHYLQPLDVIRNLEYFDMKYLNVVIINAIEDRLINIMGDDYDKFRAIMDKHNLVISGSIITEAILGETWDGDLDMFYDQDVDLGVYRNHGNSPDDLLKEFNNFKEIFNMNENPDKFYSYLNDLKIKNVVEYLKGSQRIQLICIHPYELYGLDRGKYVNEEDSWNNEDFGTYYDKYEPEYHSKPDFISNINKYIIKNFDFNVCANLYYVENGVSKIKINYLDAIVNKFISLRHVNIFTRNKRIKKYQDRGFKFDRTIPTESDELDINRRFPRINPVIKYYICNQDLPDEYTNEPVERGIYFLRHNMDVWSERTSISKVYKECSVLSNYSYRHRPLTSIIYGNTLDEKEPEEKNNSNVVYDVD